MNLYHNKQLLNMCLVLLCAYGLTGCQSEQITNNLGESITPITTKVSANQAVDKTLTSVQEESWNASDAVSVSFADGKITTQDSGVLGVLIDGTTMTITSSGTYLLSGTLEDGQVLVDVGKQDTVRLILNGVNISNSKSAAIYVKQAKAAIITLADSTQNNISDALSYVYPDATTDEPNAAIFSKGDLTINGTGSLTVNGNSQNGIISKDNLIISNGNITVTAVNDGLRGRDSVNISKGNFTLNTGGDGIQSNNDEDTTKGWITLSGGNFEITSQGDGIQAETNLQISGGDYQITTGGGSANAAAHTENEWGGGGGARGKKQPETQSAVTPSTTAMATTALAATTTTTNQTISTKALKSGVDMTITNANFNIDAQDDSLHSNNNATIDGGTFSILTGDDGMHADGALTINGGTVGIVQSYEGLEGASVTINAGTINLKATDDGINAAGGSDTEEGSTVIAGTPPQDNFRSDSSHFILITGGYLYVDASGDGLDSNGDIYMNGGTVLVNGPSNSGNGALDYNGKCESTAGVLVTVGNSGMMQTPADTSTQNSLAVVYSATQQAGTLVSITAQDGSALLSFAPAKEYQSIVISMPELKQGETYTISTGGVNSTEPTDGYYLGGTVSGSTKLTDVTLSAVVTKISDNGTAVTGGMGGGMGGGMKGQGGMGGGRGTPPQDGTSPPQQQSGLTVTEEKTT